MMKQFGQQFRNFYSSHRLYFVILSYFLLFDLIVLGMGIFIYKSEENAARREALMQLHAKEEQCADQLQERYQQIYSAGQNLLNNFYIKSYLKLYDQAETMDRIRMIKIPSVLSASKESINGIDEIFLYNASSKGFIGDGIVSKEMYYKSLYVYEGLDSSIWNEMLNEVFSVKVLPVTKVNRAYSTGGGSKRVLPIVTRDYVNGNRTVIVVNLDVEMYLQEIRDVCTAHNLGFTLTDQNGGLIENYRTQNTSEWIKADPVALGNGWCLNFALNLPEYMESASGILILTSILCLLTVLAGFALSFIFSYRLYNPLHHLQDSLEKTRRKMLARNTGNFDNREKHELLKLQEDVQNITESYSRLLDEYSADMESAIMLYVLYGRLEQSRDEFRAHLIRRYRFTSEALQCFILQFAFMPEFEEQKEIEKKRLMDTIQKLLESVFYTVAPVCIVGHGELGFLILVNSEEPEKIERTIYQILDILKNDENWFLPYVGGSQCQRLSELQQAYDEARTALEYAMFNAKTYQLQFGQPPLETLIKYHSTEEEQLLEYLKKGDLPHLRETLEQILKQNVTPNHSWRSIRQLFERIYRTGSISLAAHLDEGSPVDLLNCNIQQMVEVLMERFREILSNAGVFAENPDNRLIASVCDYIGQHYAENISLTTVAEHVGYSSKYMSRLFKESMNWNLSDYINYVRIEKAKELLRTTNEPIDEIQELVGIPSRTTFLRVFKKFEGITPGQYRKLKSTEE